MQFLLCTYCNSNTFDILKYTLFKLGHNLGTEDDRGALQTFSASTLTKTTKQKFPQMK